ncbi:hypothetical protein [Halobellus litoreus]|uniref:Uncharacterized protein n=1 Tax=Halobellus litoreus TaxID=755310 RepID=A0ABD6DYN8_9EURY|nr:hypothetical protein [Halobellus litoreus]
MKDFEQIYEEIETIIDRWSDDLCVECGSEDVEYYVPNIHPNSFFAYFLFCEECGDGL